MQRPIYAAEDEGKNESKEEEEEEEEKEERREEEHNIYTPQEPALYALGVDIESSLLRLLLCEFGGHAGVNVTVWSILGIQMIWVHRMHCPLSYSPYSLT